VKCFRYGADPLCVAACALYALNRFAIKPQTGAGFFHNHFNDVLLIPAALPWLLWISRLLGWRRDDLPPTWREVAVHAVLWALICEGFGPRVFAHLGTADWLDVAAYFCGAVPAWFFWNRRPRARPGNLAQAISVNRVSS
jgi:hypothetical protein